MLRALGRGEFKAGGPSGAATCDGIYRCLRVVAAVPISMRHRFTRMLDVCACQHGYECSHVIVAEGIAVRRDVELLPSGDLPGSDSMTMNIAVTVLPPSL